MKIHLNLADRTYINRRAVHAAYMGVGLVLLVLLVVNLTFFLRSRGEIAELEARLSELRERAGVHAADAAPQASPAAQRQLFNDIAFADSILEKDSFRWTQLLDRLETLLPEGVALRSVLPDHRNRSLNMTAVARGLEEMTAFLDRLMESDDLRNVYLLRQERTNVTDFAGREREALLFSLTLQEAF